MGNISKSDSSKVITPYAKCLHCDKIARIEFVDNKIDRIKVYCEGNHSEIISLVSYVRFIKENKAKPNLKCDEHNKEIIRYCKNCKAHQCERCFVDKRFTHEYLPLQLSNDEIDIIYNNINREYKSIDDKIKEKNEILFKSLLSLFSVLVEANFAYLNYNTVYNIKYINNSMKEIIKELSKPLITFTEIKTEKSLESSPVFLLKDNKTLLLTLGQILCLIDKETFETKARINSDFSFDKSVELDNEKIVTYSQCRIHIWDKKEKSYQREYIVKKEGNFVIDYVLNLTHNRFGVFINDNKVNKFEIYSAVFPFCLITTIMLSSRFLSAILIKEKEKIAVLLNDDEHLFFIDIIKTYRIERGRMKCIDDIGRGVMIQKNDMIIIGGDKEISIIGINIGIVKEKIKDKQFDLISSMINLNDDVIIYTNVNYDFVAYDIKLKIKCIKIIIKPEVRDIIRLDDDTLLICPNFEQMKQIKYSIKTKL